MRRPAPLPHRMHEAVLLTREAERHGTSRGRLRRGDVAHPFHGVSVVGPPPADLLERVLAYLPLLDPGHSLSHTTAALLFHAPLPPRAEASPALHVSSLGAPSRPRTRGVVPHELHSDAVERIGLRVEDGQGAPALIPVLSPADTWCHLAARLEFRDLVAVGDRFVSGRRTDSGREPPLCSPEGLRTAVDRHRRRRGITVARQALAAIRSPVDSRPETHLRLLLVDAGFPEPLPEHPTLVDGGASVLHPDLAWPGWRVVLEYEGEHHRTDARRFQDDILRRERFEAAGHHVVRVTKRQLFHDPVALVARIRAALRHHASRSSRRFWPE